MAITTAHSIGSDQPIPTVYTKDVLLVATAWTERSYLFCDSLELRVNGWDVARLSYDFGANILQPGGTSLATYAPLDLVGKFVRVTSGSYNWYGFIIGEDKDREAGDDGTLTGRRQFFQAVGLAYFLDRKQIRSAYIHDQTEIGRGLMFNGGNSDGLAADRKSRANMHPADDTDGYRCFFDPSATASAAEVWTATDIANHVLWYHGPRDTVGTQRPCRYWLGAGSAQHLDDWAPTIRTENRTPKDVLDALANPQRGLCWWAEYEDSATFDAKGHVYIHVNSLTQAAITLTQGGTLPANTNQDTLNFDGDAQVSRVSLAKPSGRGYKRVVCRGARQTGTATIGYADSTLEANFDDTDYFLAASLTAGYGSLSDEEKEKANDTYRRDDRFDRVYSSYTVPNDWDGETGDGMGGPADAYVFPSLTSAGVVDGQLPHHWPGLRVLPYLPFAPGGVDVDPDNPEFQKPFAVVRVAASPNRCQFVEKLGDADFSDGVQEAEEITASYHLWPESDVLGVRLKSSKKPHTLAKNHWAGAAISDTEPELDWQTLRATVAIEADAYCEGSYPTPAANVPIEELVIDMGDAYRLDYITPGTVLGLMQGFDVGKDSYDSGSVGVASGVVTLTGGTFPAAVDEDWTIVIDGTKYTVDSRDSDTQVTLTDLGVNVTAGAPFAISDMTGGVLRDDRQFLTDFARFAYEWYTEDRRELSVAFKRIDFDNFALGQMITTIGSGTGVETVNTVLGSIAFDFGAGTTTIRTIPDSLNLPELLS